MAVSDRSALAPIDELDRQLVERLRADGRESNRSIARALGVNEVTIAGRLRRLEAESALRVVALTDMESFGYAFMAFVMIDVRDRPPLDVAEELAGLAEAISVVVASGRFDVHVTVLARDRAELGRILSQGIAAVPGVAAARAQLALGTLRYEQHYAALKATGANDGLVPQLHGCDELDLAMIEALQRDARMSNRRIASDLSVSEGTVRTRLRRLEQEGHIHISAVSDVETFGLHASAWVGVNVKGGRVDEVGAALLEEAPEAVVVSRTLGEFEYVLVVAAESRDQLVAVLLERISRIDGVAATETFEMYAVLKHVYTWARVIREDRVRPSS